MEMPESKRSAAGEWISYREDIKVLDATIRDGGLMNDHMFDDKVVKAIYDACVEAGIDYLELGYKASKKIFARDKFGAWKYCDEDDIRRIVGENDTSLKLTFRLADIDDGQHVQIRIEPPVHEPQEPTKLVHDALKRDPTTLFFHRAQFLDRLDELLFVADQVKFEVCAQRWADLSDMTYGVSLLNDCSYCAKHHGASMKRLMAREPEKYAACLEQLHRDHPGEPFTAAEQEALEYARKLTLAPGFIAECDLQPMREAGYSDGEIFEVNQVAAYFAYANRVVTGLGVHTEGEQLGLCPSDEDDWEDA